MTFEEIINKITETGVEYGPKLLGAIVVLIIGTWVVKALTKGFSKLLDRKNVDESLKPFLRGIINILLRILLVLSVLAASLIPSLVLGFFSGAFIDRYNRKKIIIGTDLIRGINCK